jgi:hypothetical protein
LLEIAECARPKLWGAFLGKLLTQSFPSLAGQMAEKVAC